MILVIAGGRNIDKQVAFDIWEEIYQDQAHPDIHISQVDEYVSGCCRTGPDQVPFMLRAMGRNTPIKEFWPDWNKHGKAAGPIRNRQMAEYVDAALLIWDGKSRGSASMKREMEKLGKPVYEVII